MINYILLIGALLGLSAVGTGAYVDHVLSHAVDVKTLSMIKTALHYHQLYAIIITLLGLTYHSQNNPTLLKLAAWLFITGTILFSFSIYLAAFTNTATWIKLTPFGGTLLIIGWIILACASLCHLNKQ